MREELEVELEELVVEEPPEPAPKAVGAKTGKLRKLPDPFVRVRVAWLTEPGLFGPKERLFLWLLHASRWGQRKVKLTADKTAEIGITSGHQSRYVRELERGGWVSVEQPRPRAALIVTVLVSGSPLLANCRGVANPGEL